MSWDNLLSSFSEELKCIDCWSYRPTDLFNGKCIAYEDEDYVLDVTFKSLCEEFNFRDESKRAFWNNLISASFEEEYNHEYELINNELILP